MSSKKLFLFDIDGTIIDGSRNMSEVSSKTKYAIKELAKDNYCFIASGRCKGLLDNQILALGCNGYILCNGAYAEVNNEKIYEEFLDQEAVEQIIDCSIEKDGFYVLESLNRMFVNDVKAPKFIKFLQHWGQSIEKFENRNDLNHRYHVAMIGFNSEENCLYAEKRLQNYATLLRHNGFKSYDVNIKGIDKGIGAKRVSEFLGISIDNTYCFGDGINDLEMLQAVGHPVIMANADEKIKCYGFEETYDVLEDGVYRYLVDNKLIKPL